MSDTRLNQPRVLVVEDEFLIRLTLIEALSDEGFEVIEAESGDDALPILESDGAISLLLTDIQLPGSLNGHALAERVRANKPDLPVIFMTGRAQTAQQGSRSTRDIFIAKPYALTDICNAAKRLTSAASGA